MSTTEKTRAVLRVNDMAGFCEALCSGRMPTQGVDHFDVQADASRVIIRGTLEGVASATTFLYREGVVS